MEANSSVETYRKLEKEFEKTALHRPMRIDRYVDGTELTYEVTSVAGAKTGTVRLAVDKFVGGGFAGQVYRVKILDAQTEDGSLPGIEPGAVLAMKILVPPSNFSKIFRNTIYWMGFQGPFQLQVNPAAARSGAIWQKFIRQGAKARFGDENSVVDIHATFVDAQIGSCGELSEWIAGRTWQLEVDEHLDTLGRWSRGKKVDETLLGSPEFRAKRKFMDDFVKLLHDMGAPEFARQYEWSTCKSQPNCLKRDGTDDDPEAGLVAVDFRAGLALLAFLPMSPGDFKLIGKGLLRGSLVQFDRGDEDKLERFTKEHPDEFSGMEGMFEELKAAEAVYRDSVPDITHNHVRLLTSPSLWSTIMKGRINGWAIQNLVDESSRKKLAQSKVAYLLFFLAGCLPLLGRFLRKFWGRPEWREHYKKLFTSVDYFKRAVRGKLLEKIIGWHRAGRMDDEGAMKLAGETWRCLYHIPLSLLPATFHRLLTDLQYVKSRFDYLALRPIRLYFKAELRAQWLRDMVAEGKKKRILSDEDAEEILSQADEPFIQQYLKCLTVHMCTAPITQIVSVLVAAIYILTHPEMPWKQSSAIGLGIIALFQVVPLSPGSLVRGLYVVYLVVKQRNFKDYNIAVFLGFFKYVGYLAFPIQMAYRYPTLARFMAGHWTTDAVHIVPVFGERGALLERAVYDLFYNWPLTVRRRMTERIQERSELMPRYWHVPVCALTGALVFCVANLVWFQTKAGPGGLKEMWMFTLAIPILSGALVTVNAGGLEMWRRVVGGALCGAAMGLCLTVLYALPGISETATFGSVVVGGVWKIFVFTIFSTVGAVVTELMLPGRNTI